MIVHMHKNKEESEAHNEFTEHLRKMGYSSQNEKDTEGGLELYQGSKCVQLFDDTRWYMFPLNKGIDPETCVACGKGIEQFKDYELGELFKP